MATRKKKGIPESMRAAMDKNRIDFVMNNPRHIMATPDNKAMWDNLHRSGDPFHTPKKDNRFVF